MEKESGMRNMTEEDAKLYFANGWVHFCGLAFPPRHGVRLFCTLLEFKYFPPDTEENDKFILMNMSWKKMEWIITSIPEEYMPQAKVVAKISGLKIKHTIPVRIKNPDNIMVIASLSIPRIEEFKTTHKLESFPLQSPTLHTLEYESQHTAYRKINTMDLIKKEGDICDRIINGEGVELDEIKNIWKSK